MKPPHASAERLVRAIERATSERLPLLAAGLRRHPHAGRHVAFAQMVKFSAVIAAHYGPKAVQASCKRRAASWRDG